MKLYRLYQTKEAAQKDAPKGSKVVAYRDKWIIVAYVNFGVALGTILTYIGGKI